MAPQFGNEIDAVASDVTKLHYKVQIKWPNVFFMIIVHLGAIYGIYCAVTDCNLKTLIFMAFLMHMTSFGILVTFMKYIYLFLLVFQTDFI